MTLERDLREHHFTAGLPEQQLAKLAALAREVKFEPDQLILRTGQRSTDFYLLTSGSVCVEAQSPVYTVRIQVLKPGEAFGWSSFLAHHDTLFQARAREASTAICWDGSQISGVCRKYPEFGVELFSRLLELVGGRVKATEATLAEFFGGGGASSRRQVC